MKKLLLMNVLMAGCLSGYAQEAVSSGGDHEEAGSLAVSWSLGQLMTETYTAGDLTLTQGMHQMSILILTPFTQKHDGQLIKVYPNPSVGWLKVEDPKHVYSSYEILDMKGISVMNGNIHNNLDLQVDHLSAGKYILLLKEPATGNDFTFNLIIH